MRRSDQEICDREEIDQVIRSCKACHLGLVDNDTPYVIPMCFGYDGKTIYLHCAGQGRKLDILKKNNRVCVEFSQIGAPIPGKTACAWNMEYKSVIAFGNARFIENLDDKCAALQSIVTQYSPKPLEIPKKAAEHTCVIALDVEEITGKHS